MPDIIAIKKSIIQACKYMQEKKMVIGTWGNISIRTGEDVIITPSRIKYDELTPEDLPVLDLNKNRKEGFRIPSSETDIHLHIYQKRKDVNCVIHNHSPYASVFAVAELDIPPITEEQSQVVGGIIKCTPRYVPGDKHIELAELVTSTLDDDKNAVLISHHGVVCCGENLEETLIVAEIVEKTAQLYLFSKLLKDPNIIPEHFVKEENHRYKYKYGKA